MSNRCQILIVVMAVLTNVSVAAAQQPNPDSPRYKAVVALSDFLTSTGDEALKRFVGDRVYVQLSVDGLGEVSLRMA